MATWFIPLLAFFYFSTLVSLSLISLYRQWQCFSVICFASDMYCSRLHPVRATASTTTGQGDREGSEKVLWKCKNVSEFLRVQTMHKLPPSFKQTHECIVCLRKNSNMFTNLPSARKTLLDVSMFEVFCVPKLTPERTSVAWPRIFCPFSLFQCWAKWLQVNFN